MIYKHRQNHLACDIIFDEQKSTASGTVTFKTGFVLNSAVTILCNIKSVRYSKSYSIMSHTRIVTERG